MNKVVCIVQARMSSNRLPGKVLMPLGGKSILMNVVDRLKRCSNIDEIVVATSTLQSDNDIYGICTNNKVSCYRGDIDNVLERYFKAAKKYSADIIVRITADCPLIDPDLIDKVIEYFKKSSFDYASPRSVDGLIRGLDVEVFSMDVLEKVYNSDTTLDEKEHVTMHIYKNFDKYSIGCYNFDSKFKRQDIRLCVDEEYDYKLLKELYDNVIVVDGIISVDDVIEYLDRNEDVKLINKNVRQNTY